LSEARDQARAYRLALLAAEIVQSKKNGLNPGFVAIQIFGFFASRGAIDVERTNVRFAPRAFAHK
jgi:hypothetical protein